MEFPVLWSVILSLPLDAPVNYTCNFIMFVKAVTCAE